MIDTYLSRMHSSTEKDLEFSKRIIRYRETLSHSVEQARIDGQHRQRLLYQNNTLNTLSSSPSIKREAPLPSSQPPPPAKTSLPTPAAQSQPSLSVQQQQQQQQKSNGTTLIQLPLAKQDELLNAVLKKLRHVNLPDLQVFCLSMIEKRRRCFVDYLGTRYSTDGINIRTETSNTKIGYANCCFTN